MPEPTTPPEVQLGVAINKPRGPQTGREKRVHLLVPGDVAACQWFLRLEPVDSARTITCRPCADKAAKEGRHA